MRIAVALLASTAALVAAIPASARTIPFLPSASVGFGAYLPLSPNSAVEGSTQFPGGVFSSHQSGGVSIELEVQPGVPLSGYQLSAAYLGSFEKVSVRQAFPGGPAVGTGGTETVSQIPITIERASGFLHVVRFGAGIGYDFVHLGNVPASFSPPAARNGIVGDAFAQLYTGGGSALEAKLYVNQRAALNGVAISFVSAL